MELRSYSNQVNRGGSFKTGIRSGSKAKWIGSADTIWKGISWFKIVDNMWGEIMVKYDPQFLASCGI